MPRTPKPKVLGPWKRRPNLDPAKFKVGKAGPKSKLAGQFVAKRIGPAPASAPAPAAPQAPTGPYADLAGYPTLRQSMLDLDQAQASHQAYVADKVMPWQAAALQGLQGFNAAAQNQLLAAQRGLGGGAYGAAAAATPMQAGATTPGGVVAGPHAYLQQAQAQQAQGLGSAATGMAEHQAALAKIQPATLAMGYTNALSDYARGLPDLYTAKRNERRAQIDEFIAEVEQAKAEQALKEQQFAFEQIKFEETLRSNRVDESIRATNAETQAAIAFGNLGLRAEDLAAENAPDLGPIPVGYVRTPDGRYVRDPSYVPPAGAQGGSASTKYTRNWFLEKGWKKVPAKAGPATKRNAITAVDGSGLWLKPASGSGSGSSTKRRPSTELGEELLDLYFGEDREGTQGFGGWEQEFEGRPKDAATQVVRWVLENKASFMGANRAVNRTALQSIVNRLGPDVAKLALDILGRGYITPNGKTWRPT